MFLLGSRFCILPSPFKPTILTSFLLIMYSRIDYLTTSTPRTLFSPSHSHTTRGLIRQYTIRSINLYYIDVTPTEDSMNMGCGDSKTSEIWLTYLAHDTNSVKEGFRVAPQDSCSDYDVVRSSIAHPEQGSFEVRMDMAYISCSDCGSSCNLFQASTEKMTQRTDPLLTIETFSSIVS